MRKICHCLVLVLLVAFVSTPLAAQEFFKGKTIRMVVGYAPGGGFDTFARLIARHLGRHIPGNPTVIVVNMPGAGSLAAANRVYTMQPGNGLTIVAFHYGLIAQAITGDPNVKFDPGKFLYLGDPTLGSLPETLYVRKDLDIRTLADLRNSKKTITLGATGVGSGSSIGGNFLKWVGLPVKNIYGYRGSANVMAAMVRGEVDGRVTSQATMEGVYKRYIESGLVHPIISMGEEPRLKAIPGVATFKDLNLNPEQQAMANFVVETWKLLRVFAVPPGTPANRVEVLREAFMAAGKSPELAKDAERQGVISAPVSGQRVAKIVRQLMDTPKTTVAAYKTLIGSK